LFAPSQVSAPLQKTPSSQDVPAGAVEQTDGDALLSQVQHVSTWQVSLHPSPLTVLPSSHCSPASRIPLPQAALAVMITRPDPARTPALFTWLVPML
jgi:hypothetical protein